MLPCPVCWRPLHGRGIAACQCFSIWGRRPAWPTEAPLVCLTHRLLQAGILQYPRRDPASYGWFQPRSQGLPVTVLVHEEASPQAAPYFGCSTYSPTRVVLCTWPGQSPTDQVVTLVHEVAHLLVGDITPREHSSEWAGAYRAIVRGMWNVTLSSGTDPDQVLTRRIQQDPSVPWFADPPRVAGHAG